MGFEPVGLGLAVSSVPRGRAQTKRGVQICRGDSGLARTLITLSDWRSKSSPATLQAFIDLCVTSTREDSVDESPRGDCQSPIGVAALKDASSAEAPADEAGWSARAPGQPVDESPRGDSMNGPEVETLCTSLRVETARRPPPHPQGSACRRGTQRSRKCVAESAFAKRSDIA